ncbi:MAG: septal ring lytic transglycosylase RlpA family protein [Deltaproteobacteria bacterium]|nr:septal ring lytic transglycosylase RlpA family protein [Deltaproteobacteria bacterium]
MAAGRFQVSLLLGLCLIACSCVGPSLPSIKRPPESGPETRGRAYRQRGIASWYGGGFHGRQTASGEIYDMYEMTAAHRTLPLGTSVMVTNLENHRSVGVRINDRGPFVRGRIIDLSYAAARAIGMVEKGTARVEVVALDMADHPYEEPPSYTVQVGAFSEKGNALRLLRRLRSLYGQAYMTVLELDGERYYRVRVGRFESKEGAYPTAENLVSLGYSVLITCR